MSDDARRPITYADAGVNLAAREAAARRFGAAARRTHGPQVLTPPGAFAGLFALGSRLRDPVLVSSTDGLGTKPLIHLAMGTLRLAGHDIVNNNVGDLVTTGAEPLFFLDYLATNGLAHEGRLEIVEGIAEACEAYGMALLGGETADMPDVYRPGEFDLAGFVVGAVERSEVIDGSRIRAGDALVALPSNGLMTNGYSLVREIWGLGKGLGAARERDILARDYEELEGRSLGEALTAPHPSFWSVVRPVLPRIRGMAHITGGGLPGNVPRMLPEGLAARLERDSWRIPGLFALIRGEGNVEDAEMFRAFNMGVGMVLAVAPADAGAVLQETPGAWRIGAVEPRGDGPALRGLPGTE